MPDTVSVSVEVDWHAECGEGPYWDARNDTLHWVDIIGGTILSTELARGLTSVLALPTMVGAAVPAASGGFVVAATEGFAFANTAGAFDVRERVLTARTRMNDAKCDARGRLWAGSTDLDFAAGGGELWVLDERWHARRVLDGLTLPNGLGWSPDGSVFYLVDSIERVLFAFDFDADAAALSRRRVLARFDSLAAGLPDGLCVDEAGDLWLAIYGGSSLLVISPNGDILREVRMPVAQPTSCAFVGRALDKLVITSAAADIELPGSDGSVFAVASPGIRGLAVQGFAG